MTEWNEPVYPSEESFGLRKREYFAAMAMQGLCAVQKKGEFDTDEECYAMAAKISVIAADALIEALNKK